jgi:outer membrane protein OmpA-like peptidoglycan-associated protein
MHMFAPKTLVPHTLPCLAAAALALSGCATTQAPQELVDARRAYVHAHDGPARALVPAQVLAAQQALARAEQAFVDAPDSPLTRDLAYIAERRAEISEADAALAADRKDKAQAQADLAQLQVDKQARTQAELSETRQELASERQALAAQGEKLTAEQRARRAAEHTASAALASLEKVARVKEEARGLVITLNGAVLFATGQSALLPIAQDRLQQVARALDDNPTSTFLIEGHTDSTGSAAANEELSRRRAEAVREFLVAHGVDAARVRAAGLGSSRPVADNKTPEGRANNRRVEIVIERAH